MSDKMGFAVEVFTFVFMMVLLWGADWQIYSLGLMISYHGIMEAAERRGMMKDEVKDNEYSWNDE